MFLLLVYSIKLSLCLAVVYLFYQLILRKLTFYNSNRWYLAGYTLLSFFIPLINITPVLEQNSASGNMIVQFIPAMNESALGMENAETSPLFEFAAFTRWGIWEWLSFALMAGAMIFLLRFIFRCLSFFRMRRLAHLVLDRGMKLYQVNNDIIPFSFGNSVFINSDLHTEEELREIIRHEFVHVKQKHTIDIIWSEWLCIINWYNPFAWLLRSSIRQNLEFIADHKVLENGVDRKQYQYLLLKVIGNNHFRIAQKFNFSSLKKRIAMMNKLRSAKLNLTRFLFILPLLAIVIISFRQKRQEPAKAPVAQAAITISRDTVPMFTQPNNKGYIINVIDEDGNRTIVIKDKNQKLVDSVLLTKWNEKESYYEEKYGKIPPPPPPLPAMPPAPPSPPKLPDNVKDIRYDGEKAEVQFKNGTKERYDLNVPDQRSEFEKKYGYPIQPPAAPAPPKYPDKVSSIHVNNERAEVWFKDGDEEIYDLEDPAQKESFEKKYGNFPATTDLSVAPALPAKVIKIIRPGEADKIAELCDDFEIRDRKAIMHLKNGQTETYDLNDTNSRRKFEEKFGKISHTMLPVTAAPVAVVSQSAGSPVVATTPKAVPAIVAIDAAGTPVDGKKEVLVTISRKTTPQQLEEFKQKMNARGFELQYDHTDYKDGKLVSIKGSIKLKDNTGRFSATDFSRVILSTVTKGQRVIFEVAIEEKNKVI